MLGHLNHEGVQTTQGRTKTGAGWQTELGEGKGHWAGPWGRGPPEEGGGHESHTQTGSPEAVLAGQPQG